MIVATVLTVYGIETNGFCFLSDFDDSFVLQQYLPFTVLKRIKGFRNMVNERDALQQYLPFTVLKLIIGYIFGYSGS